MRTGLCNGTQPNPHTLRDLEREVKQDKHGKVVLEPAH